MTVEDIRKRLEEIKTREQAATRPPWIDTSTKETVGCIASVHEDDYADICCDIELDDREADRAFISNSRDDIPWLITIVESLLEADDARTT